MLVFLEEAKLGALAGSELIQVHLGARALCRTRLPIPLDLEKLTSRFGSHWPSDSIRSTQEPLAIGMRPAT
jgi:hypothetical protein